MSNTLPAEDISREQKILLRLCGGMIGVMLLWAAFGSIEQSVKAGGKIIPAGQNRVIQHLEGGIIADILVEEGQIVKNGEVLFRIQNESAGAKLRENEIELQGLQAKQIRLSAEVEDVAVPEFPEDLERAIPQVIASEMSLFHNKRNQRNESLRIVQQQAEQKRLSLRELETQKINLSRELGTMQQQLDITTRLEKEGAASTTRLLELRGRTNRLQTELGSISGRIPVLEAEISEAMGRIDETRSRFNRDILEELTKTKIDIERTQERLKSDGDRVNRTAITSPVEGIVNKLYVHTAGGIVQPGEKIAEITPAGETLIVEAKINSSDRGKIWPGQNALVKITAFEFARYGGVDGKVIDISADSFIDEQQRSSYYRVKISLERSELKGGKQIIPGMIVEANILTGEKTVLEYLLFPLVNAVDDALSEP